MLNSLQQSLVMNMRPCIINPRVGAHFGFGSLFKMQQKVAMGDLREVHSSGAHLCHFYKGPSPIFNTTKYQTGCGAVGGIYSETGRRALKASAACTSGRRRSCLSLYLR